MEGDITTARGPTRGGMPDDDVPMMAEANERFKQSSRVAPPGETPTTKGREGVREISGNLRTILGKVSERRNQSGFTGVRHPLPCSKQAGSPSGEDGQGSYAYGVDSA